MTTEQISAIRERCDAATPGPWSYDGMHNEIHCDAPGESYFLIVSELRRHPQDELLDRFGHSYNPDFDFAANARQDVPALLDHNAKLRQELEAEKESTRLWKARAERAEKDSETLAARCSVMESVFNERFPDYWK